MDKATSSKSLTLRALLVAGLLMAAGLALAGNDPGALDAEAPAVREEDADSAAGPAKALKTGMSLEEALQIVGKAPDSEEEVGAACGMLDVLTYDDGTQIISVDGTVTSIVEGKKQ